LTQEHDPEKWTAVFPKGSCSNKEMTGEHDSTRLKHALAAARLFDQPFPQGYQGRLDSEAISA
jgi:hypothetical protein